MWRRGDFLRGFFVSFGTSEDVVPVTDEVKDRDRGQYGPGSERDVRGEREVLLLFQVLHGGLTRVAARLQLRDHAQERAGREGGGRERGGRVGGVRRPATPAGQVVGAQPD